MCKLDEQIAAALGRVRKLKTLTGKDVQECLRSLRTALLAAEVSEEAICMLVSMVLDRTADAANGAAFADLLDDVLCSVPCIAAARGNATDRVPLFARPVTTSLWDLKELSNRLPHRSAQQAAWPAMVVERRAPRHLPMARPRRFDAPGVPSPSETRDARMDGEKMTRMLRALGQGDGPEPPDMGQPALLV
jgi:hypothetical protein